MGAVELSSGNFKDTVEKGGIVLVDWWAEWCGPCRAFSPIFEQAAERHPDIVFGKINTDDQRELATAFEIRSIPTLMIFRDRVLLFAQPGSVSTSGLEHLIQQTRSLDMDKVRQEIEAREKAARN